MKKGMTMVAHTCLAVISSLTAAQAQVSYYIGKDTVMVGESVMVNASGNFDPAGNEYPVCWVSTPYDQDDDFPSWKSDPYYTWRRPGSYLRDFNNFTGSTSASAFVTFTRPGRHYVDLRFGNDNERPMPGVISSTPGSETRKQLLYIDVAAPYDYESFDKALSSKWVASGMTRLGDPNVGFAPTWYSATELPGKLKIHTYNDSAKPLHYTNSHPTLLTPIRNIQSNYAPIIQTEFEVSWSDGSNHFVGLCMEAEENGTTVKYVFGVNGNGTLAAKRSAGGAFVDIPASPNGNLPPVTTGKIRLRISYGGFHKGLDFHVGTSKMGVWHYYARHQIAPQPVVFTKGGVFLSTTSPEHTSVLFDNFVQVTDYANNFEEDVLSNALRITEIMYHPKSPDTVEYIELKNVSSSRINLKDACFTKGVALTFGEEYLEPYEMGVVTNNRAACRAMYPKVRVLGEYHGNLNDDGEEIHLMDPSMLMIHSFSYDDASPWPTAADGGGSAIEIINWNPANYNNASNWRVAGAYPGAGPDTDGDGSPDSHEAIFGTSPTNPNSKPVITAVPNPSGHMVITWPCINGGLYIVEYCSNLGEPWAVVPGSIPPDVVALVGTSGSPGNPGSMSYTDTSVTGATQRFYRVRGY